MNCMWLARKWRIQQTLWMPAAARWQAVLPSRLLDRPAISPRFLPAGYWVKGGWCCFCWKRARYRGRACPEAWHGKDFSGLKVFFFLGCSFSLVEITSKAGETLGKLLSFILLFFLKKKNQLTLRQQIGNNECKSIPQHVQMHFVAWKLSSSSDELSASDSSALTICNLLNILTSHRGYYSSAFFPLLYSSNRYCNLNAVGWGLKEILAGSMLCSIFLWQQRGREWIAWFFLSPLW